MKNHSRIQLLTLTTFFSGFLLFTAAPTHAQTVEDTVAITGTKAPVQVTSITSAKIVDQAVDTDILDKSFIEVEIAGTYQAYDVDGELNAEFTEVSNGFDLSTRNIRVSLFTIHKLDGAVVIGMGGQNAISKIKPFAIRFRYKPFFLESLIARAKVVFPYSEGKPDSPTMEGGFYVALRKGVANPSWTFQSLNHPSH